MQRGKQIVYVVDDDQAMRDSLQWLLESAGMRVQTFAAAQPFLDMLQDQDATADPPGTDAAGDSSITACALLDLRLPGMSGLELQQTLNRLGYRLPVIMITGHGDVPMAVTAMKEGALDFIQKPFDEAVLLKRVRNALNGAADRAHGSQPPGASGAREAAQIRASYHRLSPRERQVMELVVKGWLNKQVASELGLSHKTVEVHRAHAMEKMGAASLAELVRMAVMLEQHPEPA